MTRQVRCYKLKYTEIQEREIILAGTSKEDVKKSLEQVIVGGVTLSTKHTLHEISRME